MQMTHSKIGTAHNGLFQRQEMKRMFARPPTPAPFTSNAFFLFSFTNACSIINTPFRKSAADINDCN